MYCNDSGTTDYQWVSPGVKKVSRSAQVVPIRAPNMSSTHNNVMKLRHTNGRRNSVFNTSKESKFMVIVYLSEFLVSVYMYLCVHCNAVSRSSEGEGIFLLGSFGGQQIWLLRTKPTLDGEDEWWKKSPQKNGILYGSTAYWNPNRKRIKSPRKILNILHKNSYETIWSTLLDPT